MASTERFAHRFMRLTGKLRFFLGPAHRSPLDHPVTPENQALLERQTAQAARQWLRVEREDGSVYYLERGPQD